MSDRSDRERLRGALYRADLDVLMSILTSHIWPDDALQLMGDAVLVMERHGHHRVARAPVL